MASRVAVVTGSNKGIGYACVKGLVKKFDGIVYLTELLNYSPARNVDRGMGSLEKLREESGADESKLRFHQLDITDGQSVNNFKDHLNQSHSGMDVLINSAAIADKDYADFPFGEQAKMACETNYHGTKRVTRALLPLLRQNGRLINVSARLPFLGKVSPKLRDRIMNPAITLVELNQLVDDFLSHAEAGTHAKNDFPASPYSFSKLAIYALSTIQARELGGLPRNLSINSCCPGYCKTDLTGNKGMKTADQGAETLIFLATLPSNQTELHGKFIGEKKILDWKTGKPAKS